ncbi:stimulator of interferon genes protein-like isoform X2 [Ostrea edulis]|nr:stimulator of interferon genes protein-like isoform X2 [Ostrea edulis]
MADDEGTDVDITHDVFLIHVNEPTEDRDLALGKVKPLLESRGIKVMTDHDDFRGGRSVLDNIALAVRSCRKCLIVLTEHSHNSPWCSLELLLAMEKSHRQNIMSLVVLQIGNTIEWENQLALEMLNTVPRVDIQHNNDIDSKVDELVEKIKERKCIEELLPAGNIAHAQVWSHYTGLLQYLLPEIADLIQQTELYKKNPSRFSLKLHELVPENCRCPKVIEDIPEKRSEKRIIEMDKKLPELIYKRAGNTRTVVMTIYCVKDRDGEEYYCVAEYPGVLAGIQKMIEETSTRLQECDRRVQVGRFYYTLVGLLHHESLENTLNKANVIMYNENRPGFVLADEMIKSIKLDLNMEAFRDGKIERPLDRLSSKEPAHYEKEVFLFYHPSGASKTTRDDIVKRLEEEGVKFYEDGQIGHRQFDTMECAVDQCYWTIAIMTKEALYDKTFTLQLLSILDAFLRDKKIRLIPVLVDTDVGDIPGAIRFVTYVTVDAKKRYLEQLICTIRGNDIPFEKEALIPAGDVAYGLAWTYVLNYLQYVLMDPEQEGVNGLTESIENVLIKHNRDPSLCKKKVYIIVPDSCECHASLHDADPRITKLETIHPVYVSLAGTKRPYHFDMYTFEENGKEYFFVGQYAAPVTCLNDMWNLKIAGLNQKDMVKQASKFCHEIGIILRQKLVEKFAHRCEVVSYDDSKHSLTGEMKRRIESQ